MFGVEPNYRQDLTNRETVITGKCIFNYGQLGMYTTANGSNG